MDKREQAKKECHEQAMAKFRVGDEDATPIIQAARFGFECGFDAGHAAADDWVAIETESDYPPIGQRVMLASNRAGDRLIYESAVWSEETAQYAGKGWNDYIAWMPIPEYQRPNDEEKNK